MDYFYAETEDLKQYAPKGAVDISRGSGTQGLKFGVQDTVYIIGVKDEKALVVDIFRASGRLFDRPTIKRIDAEGLPAREWSRW